MKKSLVIALVLLLLGFGGWFAYSQFKTEDKKNTNQNNQTTPQPNSNDPSEGGKYLVIKEWGVRFPKTKNTQDLIYYIDPESPNLANFGLGSLGNKYSECMPNKVGLGSVLTRSKNEVDFSPLTPFTKIGEYFYAIGGGGGSCFDTPNIPREDSDLSGLARGELSNTFQGLEKY